MAKIKFCDNNLPQDRTTSSLSDWWFNMEAFTKCLRIFSFGYKWWRVSCSGLLDHKIRVDYALCPGLPYTFSLFSIGNIRNKIPFSQNKLTIKSVIYQFDIKNCNFTPKNPLHRSFASKFYERPVLVSDFIIENLSVYKSSDQRHT